MGEGPAVLAAVYKTVALGWALRLRLRATGDGYHLNGGIKVFRYVSYITILHMFTRALCVAMQLGGGGSPMHEFGAGRLPVLA